MALTSAQQLVYPGSREDLTLGREWSDGIIIDQLGKLFKKMEDGTPLTQQDQTTIKAITERFNWLSALAEVQGFGVEPSLFANGGTVINVEWIKYWSRQRGIDITQAALEAATHAESVIEGMRENLERLKEIANAKRYEPAEGEPSIFGGERNSPGTDWMLWYSSTKKVSIIEAHDVGKQIMDGLFSELPRTLVTDQTPDMWVTSKELEKAGVKHRALSFRWVIHVKYYRHLDWHETHADGMIMLHRSV